MKRTIRNFTGSLLLGLLAAGPATAAELSAFQLIKEGNKHVGEDAKDRVTQIRSEKSIGSLTPTIWFVVFYDPDATAKATEVKFGAGKKLEVKRPARILELAGRSHTELPREKLKTDSNRAIEIATSEPMLKNLKLTASRLTLERHDGIPVWKVRLWAAKLRNPNKDADLGEIFITTEDGKVIKNDLHIDRVD
jgi:hypothetical protein